jgi:hypothetical protein
LPSRPDGRSLDVFSMFNLGLLPVALLVVLTDDAGRVRLT